MTTCRNEDTLCWSVRRKFQWLLSYSFGWLRSGGDGTGAVIRNLEGEPFAGPRYWFEPANKKAKIRAFSWHV